MTSFEIGGISFKIKNNLTKEELQVLEKPRAKSHNQKSVGSPNLVDNSDMPYADYFIDQLISKTLLKCFDRNDQLKRLSRRQAAELFLRVLEYHQQLYK